MPTDLYKEYLYFYTINDQGMFLISCIKNYIKMQFYQNFNEPYMIHRKSLRLEGRIMVRTSHFKNRKF